MKDVNDGVGLQLVCKEAYTRGAVWQDGHDSLKNILKSDRIQSILNDWQFYELVRSNSAIFLTILSVQANQTGVHFCAGPENSEAVTTNVTALGENLYNNK